MREGSGVPTTKGSTVYPQVARAIEKLGRDIALARRLRQIPAEEFARRMGVSRVTLHNLEKGSPGVSLNTLCMALHVLGRLDMLARLADQATDDVGLMMARQAAPRTVRRRRALAPGQPAGRVLPAEGSPDETGPVPDENGYVGW